MVYEVWIDASVFGDAGFGHAEIENVHASPSKEEDNTILVIPGDCPPCDTEEDGCDPWDHPCDPATEDCGIDTDQQDTDATDTDNGDSEGKDTEEIDTTIVI